MARAKQITDQLEESEKLVKQLQERRAEGEDLLNKRLGLTPDDESGQGQNGSQDTPDEEGKDPGQADSPPGSEQDPSNQGDPPPQNSSPEQQYAELRDAYDRLEHTHRVLRGKYESEVPALHAEIRQLKDQLAQRAEPEGTRREPGNTAPTAAESSSVDKIKDKLRDEFPDDVVDGVTDLVTAIVQGASSSVNPELQKLQQRVDKVEGTTRHQQLDALVPDWQALQNRPEWIPFLKEINPESGLERNDHLQDAWEKGSMKRVKSIFDSFRKRVGQKGPQPDRVAEPQSQGTRPPNPNSGSKPIYNKSEVDAFYAKVKANQLNHRDPKVRALQEEYEQAVVEGRVR